MKQVDGFQELPTLVARKTGACYVCPRAKWASDSCWRCTVVFTNRPDWTGPTGIIITRYHLTRQAYLANLAHCAKYLQSDGNMRNSFKYNFKVPWLTQSDFPYQSTLFYRGNMV